jgi:ACT domain-containing protein
MDQKQEKAVVTVVGLDKKGIISGVSALLAEENINILDISQTIVDGYFSMLMVVDIAQAKDSLQDVTAKLGAVGQKLGVVITCQHDDIFKNMHRI